MANIARAASRRHALAKTSSFPFAYSTATGIGFIAHAAIKIVSGRIRDVNAAVAIIAAAFLAKIGLG